MGSPRKNGTSGPSSSRPPTVKFARRTSSGRVVSLTRDVDEIDFSGEFATGSGSGDFINYTVLMPPTPDNQPMGDGADNDTGTSSSGGGKTGTGGVPPPPGYTGPGSEGGKGTGPTKTDRMSMMKSNQSMLIRSQTGDFDHNRWLFESKGTYGYGNAFWALEGKEDQNGYPGMDMMGGARSACPTL